MCVASTGTAQPPLPLQLFLPAQPLSPALQLPLPLHWLLLLPSTVAAGLIDSAAQPPLPLQVFLPLQPASPVLQLPLPLQSLKPLQTWSVAFLAAGLDAAAGAFFSSANAIEPAARPATMPPITL